MVTYGFYPQSALLYLEILLAIARCMHVDRMVAGSGSEGGSIWGEGHLNLNQENCKDHREGDLWVYVVSGLLELKSLKSVFSFQNNG